MAIEKLIPSEVLEKVRLLELSTKKIIDTTMAGSYLTKFRGQGMTFSEFREYVPGDDVRSIAWPLTARTGKTFIKKYEEERELCLTLVVDTSPSMYAIGAQRNRAETAAHLCALISFAALRNRDQVSLILGAQDVEKYLPPKKGRAHILACLTDILRHKSNSKVTDMDRLLKSTHNHLKRRGLVIVISDFRTSNFQKSLTLLSQKQKVILVHLIDNFEEKLPQKLGLFRLFASEKTLPNELDGMIFDPSFRPHFLEWASQSKVHQDQVKLWAQRAGAGWVKINGAENYIDQLIRFFQRAK